MYTVFIDLEKAFDGIPRKMIWETLDDPTYGVDRLIVGAFESLCTKCTSAVRTQIGEENWFDVYAGIRQTR